MAPGSAPKPVSYYFTLTRSSSPPRPVAGARCRGKKKKGGERGGEGVLVPRPCRPLLLPRGLTCFSRRLCSEEKKKKGREKRGGRVGGRSPCSGRPSAGLNVEAVHSVFLVELLRP